MNARQRDSWQAWAAIVALVGALTLPIAGEPGAYRYLLQGGNPAVLIALLMGLGALAAIRPRSPGAAGLLLGVAAHAGGGYALWLLASVQGAAGPGYWALVVASWLLAWALVVQLSSVTPERVVGMRAGRLLVPALFGIWLLFLWEVLVRGFGVPLVLMPPPGAIAERFGDSTSILWVDFQQTFLRAVLAGYAIGSLSGFVVALLADRYAFLRRGLLPIGNFVAALPIIGIAPIMVMWFGFDWPSKAAVVAVMTFFPMLVNTVAGLAATDAVNRDLMRTYAAQPRQQLSMLKLPSAMPFIFNALKINTTLALIGAIVAEFFGSPIVGMGFRISTEIGRLAVDMVWAEIAVAALAGSSFYGLMALLERGITFWHPSFRS
ncbi:MAG: ABC transporter permease [Alphaproteobacteria bacterium]